MNEIKVGLLALTAAATVVYMSFKVTTHQSGLGEHVSYRAILEDASGIFPKTPIRVAGISAGRISQIELVDNKALVTLEVRQDVAVSKNSKLTIRAVGLLGDKFLEIQLGDSEERLEEMGFITVEEGVGLSAIVKEASHVLTDVRAITRSFRNQLAPEGEQPPLSKILEGVNAIVEDVRDITLDLRGDDEGGGIGEMIANMNRFSHQLAEQTAAANQQSAMAKIHGILANTQKATEDLKIMISDIKAGKGTIGKFMVEEEIADEVQQTLAGVKQLVGGARKLRTELEIYTGANTRNGAESQLGLYLLPAPERLYYLGMVTSEFGPQKERHTSSTVGGVTTNEVYKERYKGRYRLNIQLGRKIQNWTFRGGLFESSGGVGIDYLWTGAGLNTTLDVFDYRDNLGPNVRVSTDFPVYSVFRGKVSFEDLILDSRSATFSVGLKFNDEDLKGILGFFL